VSWWERLKGGGMSRSWIRKRKLCDIVVRVLEDLLWEIDAFGAMI